MPLAIEVWGVGSLETAADQRLGGLRGNPGGRPEAPGGSNDVCCLGRRAWSLCSVPLPLPGLASSLPLCLCLCRPHGPSLGFQSLSFPSASHSGSGLLSLPLRPLRPRHIPALQRTRSPLAVPHALSMQWLNPNNARRPYTKAWLTRAASPFSCTKPPPRAHNHSQSPSAV
ncbi:hypothetical protein CCMA1212_008890 [Trichoderma ghanense]|uniref:Uncharacterized protein n=1 Tax=Trichoderma ghanense TaxID=65468 RepID=A0ABY2GTW6_9HYPO